MEQTNYESIIQHLKSFSDDVYRTAESNGRYNSKPGLPPLIMHVISELTEASSAFLYGNIADHEQVEFALKNIDNPMYYDFFKNNLKSKFEDEIADAILVLLSIAGYMKIDIAKHLVLKNQYNKKRTEHSIFNNYDDKLTNQDKTE